MFAAVLLGALAGGGGAAEAGPSKKYRLRVDAVAYHLPGKTALGIPVRKGVVAVDPHQPGTLGHRARHPARHAGHLVPVGEGLAGHRVAEEDGSAEDEETHPASRPRWAPTR